MSSKTTRFENLLEAVPDALVGVDQKGVIRFVNRQTESLFGYDRDELIGQPVEMLLPAPLWQVYAEHRENYFADPRTRSSGLDLVLSGQRRDGSEFPANISLSHIDTGDVLLVITAVGDVAKQRQAVKNAQLMTAIVQYSNDAIIASTLGGIITSWNPAAERLYGYSSQDIIGRSVSLLMPHDRASELHATLARIKDGEAVEHFETIRVRKDGTAFPVSLTVAPIRDDDGSLVGASGIHHDVTQQRNAFEAAQRMAAIVQSSDDAIIGRDLEGTVTSWNPAAEKMYGYSSQEMVGKSADLLTPKNRRGEAKAIVAKVGAGQPVEHLETTRVRKDGTVFPVSLTVSPIRDDGTIVGSSMICRDMTEQEHAAQYARSLIEAGLDPLATISPEGTITDVNEAAVRLAGIPREALIGTAISLYHTEPEKTDEIYQQVVAQGSLTDYPLTLRHQDGTLTDVLCNLSVHLDTRGDVLGVLATARDVTKQKVAFEAAQRMAPIVEYSDNAIIGSTLDGIITSWNPAAERMYGYSSKEMVSKSVDLLSPEDMVGEITSILARMSAGRPLDNFETTCIRKDRTVFPVRLTIAPIHGTNGAVVGASAIASDLTDRVWPAKDRRRADPVSAIAQFSQEAIISGTLDGSGTLDCIIASWNPAAEKMYGYSSEEVSGKSIKLLNPKDRTGDITSILASIKTGQAVENCETIQVRKDGTMFPVSTTFAPIRDENGVIVGVGAIVRDLTT